MMSEKQFVPCASATHKGINWEEPQSHSSSADKEHIFDVVAAAAAPCLASSSRCSRNSDRNLFWTLDNNNNNSLILGFISLSLSLGYPLLGRRECTVTPVSRRLATQFGPRSVCCCCVGLKLLHDCRCCCCGRRIKWNMIHMCVSCFCFCRFVQYKPFPPEPHKDRTRQL